MNYKKILLVFTISCLTFLIYINFLSSIIIYGKSIDIIDGKVDYYQDGNKLSDKKPDYSKDIKKTITTPTQKQFLNFPSGYSIVFPKDMNINLKYSSAFIRAYSKTLDIKISEEWSPYEDMKMYFKDYLNKFILNSTYRDNNSIKIIENKWTTINGYKTRIVSFSRKPSKESTQNQNEYLFAYLITKGQTFYNFFFKADSIEKEKQKIYNILNSFTTIRKRGTPKNNLSFTPVLPDWNKETQDFYNTLRKQKKPLWGFFSPHSITSSYSTVSKIEKILDYQFPIILHYMYIDHTFPIKGMTEAYERGQIVELTLQLADKNNDDSVNHNINFDIIDGKYDKQIRQFAKDAKDFSHPFLFRLNNEMNTDWCQYSGVMLLSDADLYIKIWKKIHRIFKEEGVNNAVWVFNPNDNSYPPANWNSHLSYYPGNEYVQVIGLTGYNTGDYYKDITGEKWRSFKDIYDPLVKEYRKVYSNFPWIITEFASSCIGGDKEKWIINMFKTIPSYPEIKAAVWWSYADFDTRDGKNKPARRYWLEENADYLRAFKAGLKNTSIKFVKIETKLINNIFSENSFSINPQINVAINGRIIDFKEDPILKDNKAVAPLKELCKALGATVKRDRKNINITKDTTQVNMQQVFIINDISFISIRFIAESLGLKLDWDEQTRTVNITN